MVEIVVDVRTWKDEALHSELMRGTLMRAGGFLPIAVVYAH